MAPLCNDESSQDGSYEGMDCQCARDRDAATDASRERTESCASKSEDPFLYYSDDDVRMKTLKMVDGRIEPEPTSGPRQRKTRLSFELHPSLILEDVIDELDSGDDFLDIDDRLFEADDRADSDASDTLDLLKQLLDL
ncbi:hypothetical protein ACHAWF_001373 [Thalassiosira exigua]